MERKDERGVSPVIATILMVAITVVLAAVLYVMVVNLIKPIDTQPTVVLSNLSCTATACDGKVASVSEATDLGQFRVTVMANGVAVIPPTVLAANVDLNGGGLTFRYTDIGAEGKMTGGDTFRLSGMTSGVTYEVNFLWKDGTVVQSIGFPS